MAHNLYSGFAIQNHGRINSRPAGGGGGETPPPPVRFLA